MSDATLIARQTAEIALLRDSLKKTVTELGRMRACVRQLLPIGQFHDPGHPGVKAGERLLKERAG